MLFSGLYEGVWPWKLYFLLREIKDLCILCPFKHVWQEASVLVDLLAKQGIDRGGLFFNSFCSFLNLLAISYLGLYLFLLCTFVSSSN